MRPIDDGRSRGRHRRKADAPALAPGEDLEGFAGFGCWAWNEHDGLCLSPGIRQLIMPLKPPATARALLRRVSPTSRYQLFAAIRDSLGTAETNSLSIDVNLVAGSSRSFAITLSAVRDRELTLSGLCRDASTRAQLATALERSESRWEMALESARQGVWDSDLATGVVYHSRTWRSMRGMDPDAVLDSAHDNWIDRLHPDDRDWVLRDIELQHSGEQTRIAMEYRERRPDGRYLWISSLGAPVEWFADGRPRRMIGTDTDVTERKEAEANVALLSRRLELALKVSKVGVFEVDLSTNQSFWDRRLREIYGRPLDEPVDNAEWVKAIHPDDVDWVIQSYRGAIARGDGFRGEFRITRPDGGVRTIRAESTWYQDPQGVPHILGTNWDVTEEVDARDALQRAKQLLETRNLALEEAKSRIEHNALHDMLTGLPNRRYLDRILRERAFEASVEGGGVGVLHIDLDRFKQINDTLGHVAGDAMLVHAAELLKGNLAPGEFVARIGGDEFVIVCSLDGSPARLTELAESIVRQMRKPVPYNGHYCRFGASVGIAMQRGSQVDPAQLLVDADIALYRAKARGKNGFEFFTEALQAEAIRTKELADDILRGLEQGEFIPHYQPLFDARTRRIVSVEALARWNHPTSGLLPPSCFLRVAEDLSVVNAIDHAILEQALDDHQEWQRQGLLVPDIAVNVSFRRLLDEQLLESLKKLAIPAGVVSFELLESIFLDDIDEIIGWNIAGIRDLGIELCIDDFGTGHASVLGLLRLRPDRLKIDRQFLEGIEVSRSRRRLVRSLIDIGKSLGIKVVAEGVETQRQATILTELGCDMLQGFALARPMPYADLTERLSTRSQRTSGQPQPNIVSRAGTP